VHRRDGFGAELVAVMDDPAATTATRRRQRRRRAGHHAHHTELERDASPSMTVLLRFSERTVGSAARRRAELEIHDPYQVTEVTLHRPTGAAGRELHRRLRTVAGAFNFSHQSLRSLFGGKGGIDTPHLYMMQPTTQPPRAADDPWPGQQPGSLGERRQRTDARRRDPPDFQVWQFYPTHAHRDEPRCDASTRRVLKHFDPSGKAQASHDMVLVGHSMGGVIARLMISPPASIWSTPCWRLRR
jgi:hypothetical protein